MRQGHQNKRGRGRARKSSNPLSRNYESNGPDVKIRGSASHIAEKYTSLARDAQSSGDPVSSENYWQHAEHYNRIIQAAEAQVQVKAQNAQSNNNGGQNNGNQNTGNQNNGGQRRPQKDGRRNQNQNQNKNEVAAQPNNGNAEANLTANHDAIQDDMSGTENTVSKPAKRSPRATNGTAAKPAAEKAISTKSSDIEAPVEKKAPRRSTAKSTDKSADKSAVKAVEKSAEKNTPPEDVSA